MQPWIRPLLWSLTLVSALVSPARAALTLEDRLDALYDTVAAKFVQNPWFRNSADEDIERAGSRAAPLPEFQMMDRELFRSAMKSYCVLLESPSAKLVKNRDHYGIVNFSQHSGERRFFIYDVSAQEFTHNVWTTHGYASRISAWYSLKDTGAEELQRQTKAFVLSYGDSAHATLFSNRSGSNQSSAGMAIADTQTYYSNQKEWTALRLTGVDGELNSRIRSRAVVLHEWGYDGQTMRWQKEAPLSEGCPMLPRNAFYRGQSGAEVAKILMQEVYGSPIFFYHDRLRATANESAYREQLALLRTLRGEITSSMDAYQQDYEWDAATRKRYEDTIAGQLESTYSPLIEETYKYFKNRSAYFGVEPKSTAACLKALGL